MANTIEPIYLVYFNKFTLIKDDNDAQAIKSNSIIMKI